jgi:hypothetical protein
MYWFHVLAIMNSNAINTHGDARIFWYKYFNSFGYMYSSGLARSYGSSIFRFLCLNFHTVFYNGHTNLYSY